MFNRLFLLILFFIPSIIIAEVNTSKSKQILDKLLDIHRIYYKKVN